MPRRIENGRLRPHEQSSSKRTGKPSPKESSQERRLEELLDWLQYDEEQENTQD